jgi:PAS domain S-box-containing protein
LEEGRAHAVNEGKTKQQLVRELEQLRAQVASLQTAETECKLIVQRLHATQARFQGILDSASSAIISMDEGQRIILFNDQAEHIFGYHEDEVLGQPLSMLLMERFQKVHEAHVDRFATEDVPWRAMSERQMPLTGRRKNGEEFPIEVAISKLKEDGRLIFTAVLNDITLRRQAEEERDRLYEQQALYLEQVARVTDAAAAIEGRTFEVESLDEVATRTDELGQLGRVFQRMAREVYAREQELSQQVQQLSIVIDAVQAASDVAEIKKSEYFKQLKKKAEDLRDR